MLYLDPSLLVAAAAAEDDSERILRWFADQSEAQFAISGWVEAEFASAMSIKVRRGDFSVADAEAASTHFRDNVAAGSAHLPVRAADFKRAADLAGRPAFKLRASDALHLAISEAADATLCTLDQDQAAAGDKAAIRTILV